MVPLRFYYLILPTLMMRIYSLRLLLRRYGLIQNVDRFMPTPFSARHAEAHLNTLLISWRNPGPTGHRLPLLHIIVICFR